MSKWPTESDLRRYLDRWQQLLRLQNWHIDIGYARTREMMDEEHGGIAWGRCSINENHLRVKIRVLHPDDYDDDLGREEIEVTVVHELMHVLMHGMRRDKEPDEAADVVEEQTINVTSELLVHLHRDLAVVLKQEKAKWGRRKSAARLGNVRSAIRLPRVSGTELTALRSKRKYSATVEACSSSAWLATG